MKTNAMFGHMGTNGIIKSAANEDDGVLKRIIGARVKKLREENKDESLSQDELAKALRQHGIKVEKAQIGHIEAGRRLPSVEVLLGIADYYATSIDYLTGRTCNPSSLETIDEDLQTGGVSGRLGAIYKGLPKERQEEVYKFAQAQELLAQKDDAPNTETSRFVRALLNSFERRLGRKGVKSALNELSAEFPELTSGFGGDESEPPKKKSG